MPAPQRLSEKQLAAPNHLPQLLESLPSPDSLSELGNFTATVGQFLFIVDSKKKKRTLSQLQVGVAWLINGSQNSDDLASPGGLIKKCRFLDSFPNYSDSVDSSIT